MVSSLSLPEVITPSFAVILSTSVELTSMTTLIAAAGAVTELTL